MRIKLATTALVLSTVFLAATGAKAGTITVTQQSNTHVMYDSNDQNALYAATDFMVGDTSVNGIAAGVFRLNGARENGDTFDFIAFCLEPLEGLIFPKVHEEVNIFDALTTSRLFTLASNAIHNIDTHVEAAAFQMAAWEITTEQGSNVYDIDDGYFKITGDGDRSNDAEALAQTWLDNIATDFWAPSTDSYLILKSEGTQDLITNVQTTPVPLPAAGLSFLTALIGLGGFLKRRQS